MDWITMWIPGVVIVMHLFWLLFRKTPCENLTMEGLTHVCLGYVESSVVMFNVIRTLHHAPCTTSTRVIAIENIYIVELLLLMYLYVMDRVLYILYPVIYSIRASEEKNFVIVCLLTWCLSVPLGILKHGFHDRYHVLLLFLVINVLTYIVLRTYLGGVVINSKMVPDVRREGVNRKIISMFGATLLACFLSYFFIVSMQRSTEPLPIGCEQHIRMRFCQQLIFWRICVTKLVDLLCRTLCDTDLLVKCFKVGNSNAAKDYNKLPVITV